MDDLKLNNNNSSFTKNSILFFSANVLTFLMTFLSAMLLARVLGPSGQGALSIILLIPTFAFTIMSLGVHQANIYFIGKYENGISSLISNSTSYIILIGSVLSLGIWFLRDSIASWLALPAYVTAIGLSCFLFPLILSHNIYINFLIGLKKFTERNISALLYGSLNLALIIFFVYFLKWGVQGGVLSLTVAALIASIYSFFIITRDYKFKFQNADHRLFQESVDYGFKSQLGNIFQIFNYRFDVFFVNYFLGVTSVGIYSIAVSVGELLWYISTVTGTLLFSMVSNDSQKYDDKFISSVCRKTILLTFGGALFLLLTSWILVPALFGKAFVNSITPLIILLPGIVAISIHKVLIFGLLGKGYPQYMSYSGFITLIFTVVLDVFLIPVLGVPGAALASTLAYVVCAFLTARWYIRTTNFTWYDVIIPNHEDLLFFVNYTMKNLRKINCLVRNQ